MLKIGEFSKLSRLSIRQLRDLDEAGLLEPASIDRFTGYRYYGADQLPIANRIRALKEMGFTQPAIGALLPCYGDRTAMTRCLTLRRAEVQAELDAVLRRLKLLDTALERLRLDTALERLRKDEIDMKYDVTIKTIPERYVASVRQIIPCYAREGDLWSIYCQETARMQIRDGDPALYTAIYHDGEYKEADVDVEIQKSVVGGYPDTEHVKFKTVPAVEVASATFQGSYDKIGEVNEAVAAWIQDNGYTYAGCFFNIYHVFPHMTRNPDEFVTEVCYPIRKK